MQQEVTVVSAYYIIPSKYDNNQYINWIVSFFDLNCNIVFFSDFETIELIKHKCSDKLKDKNIMFINKPFHELFYWSDKFKKIWIDHHKLDREKKIHSPELYAIWNEKTKFVMHAIQLNPFKSSKFLWVDAGCFRNNDLNKNYCKFPNGNKIPEDKMLFLNISKFIETDYINRDFKKINRIGAAIYGSGIETWKKWTNTYDKMINTFILNNVFAGKDQSIINTIYLDNPELFLLITPLSFAKDKSSGWLYLQEYLK
jgi:hypothetical protein